MVGPADTSRPAGTVPLAAYLRARAGAFDVVEYDHGSLPLPRADLPARPLLVARSVLLAQLVEAARIPRRPGLRRLAGAVVRGPAERRRLAAHSAAAARTCAEADLVNLCNDDERLALTAAGVPPEKLVVLPFGLTAARRAVLEAVGAAPPPAPRVAFVGTFDPRKGMRDFPRLVGALAGAVPGVRFTLAGTAGMLRTAGEVLAEFPPRLRPLLTVVPKFAPAELPGLLADCSAGAFPSAVEGFPFGVLEMLACALPVVAYRAPGAPMMLGPEWLVPRGDALGVAAKLAALLRDPAALAAARLAARARSRDFDWDEVAARTAAEYERRLSARRI